MLDKHSRFKIGNEFVHICDYKQGKIWAFDDALFLKLIGVKNISTSETTVEFYQLHMCCNVSTMRKRKLVATGDQEVLTSLGWKKIKNLKPDDEIAQYDYHGIKYQPYKTKKKLTRTRRGYKVEVDDCYGYIINHFIVKGNQ